MTETVTEEVQHELDPATGLPKLPTGYWWEVKLDDHEWSYASRYNVGIKYMRTVKEHTVDSDSFWGTLFKIKTIVPETTEPAYAMGTVMYDEDGVPCEYITPELVLKTAQTVMTRFLEAQDTATKRVQSRELLGDYPPKSL